jgi:hypothetical protein
MEIDHQVIATTVEECFEELARLMQDDPFGDKVTAGLDDMTVGKDEVQHLRSVFSKARSLVTVGGTRAKLLNEQLLKTIDQAVELTQYNLMVQPAPYTWAVNTYNPDTFQKMEPLLVTSIKRLLRDHFAPMQLSYDGWDD